MACDFLKRKGYAICHTNWRSGHYELDIIAFSDEELIVVEVKTRSGDRYESPERAVDERKIRRIVYAADHYIRLHDIPLPVRFDIITVIRDDAGFQIDHIPDAFYPPLG